MMKDGKEVVQDDRHRIYSNEGPYILSHFHTMMYAIDGASQSDAGRYTCAVVSHDRRVEAAIDIHSVSSKRSYF